MLSFLALCFGNGIYKYTSTLIRALLIFKGIKIGRRFYIEGIPYLKIRGKASNIQIGDDVKIFGSIDIRNRENGKILIKNNVSFDKGCRIVAANDALLLIESNCFLGPDNIINCGTDVSIGEYTISASNVLIQSSSHGIVKGINIYL